MENAQNIVDEIFALYEHHGHDDYIGEPVSQLEHMSQSAMLAQRDGYDEEVILAAFFHDIGHLCETRNNANDMGGFGTVRHEKIGADYLLKMGFPLRMARLVENHVQAKRYLTFRYPEYYERLSEASRQTLEYQGGKMTADEARLFESDPLFEASIAMRKWDDLAKETGIPVENIGFLKEAALRVLRSQS